MNDRHAIFTAEIESAEILSEQAIVAEVETAIAPYMYYDVYQKHFLYFPSVLKDSIKKAETILMSDARFCKSRD